MLRLFSLLLLYASTAACSALPADRSLTFLPTPDVSMLSSHTIMQSIRFIAREQRRPPLGTSPNADRDLGFATVFLTIENTKQEPTHLVIEQIQIEDAKNGQMQLKQQLHQAIHLKPLEHAVTDIHLTNKVGYATQNRVKAVVTYQYDRQTYVIESDAVEVERS